MTRTTVIFMAGIVTLAFCSQTVGAATVCSGSSENLKCLEQHFDELYTQNYEHFWVILNKSGDEARQCQSIKKTAEFLRLARIKTGNAEFNEFFAKTIENLCVNSPLCFKKASRFFDKETQTNLAAMFDNPLFFDREDLRRAGCVLPKRLERF